MALQLYCNTIGAGTVAVQRGDSDAEVTGEASSHITAWRGARSYDRALEREMNDAVGASLVFHFGNERQKRGIDLLKSLEKKAQEVAWCALHLETNFY